MVLNSISFKYLFFTHLLCALNSLNLYKQEYLTHYWPFKNGKMLDAIDSKDMTQGNFTNFTLDRFCKENSALALNGGWTQVPHGIYFDSQEFTISLWVYPLDLVAWCRVIDFGNGERNDNIFLTLETDNNLHQPNFQVFDQRKSQQAINIKSNDSLTLKKWQFIAVTYDGFLANVYIDGELKMSSYFNFSMKKLNRTKCYIGKSNWDTDGYSSSNLDDLRFFNVSLSKADIQNLMNQNETSKKN
jgi:hypothetical protein